MISCPFFSCPHPHLAGRKLGLFSRSIPSWCVLSHNIPRINTTSKLASFWCFSTSPESQRDDAAASLLDSRNVRPDDGYGYHAHAKCEHGEPRRYLTRGVSSARMTSATLHARDNASMPPRERHDRLGPMGKTGISITASSLSSHSLTAVLVRLTTGHSSLAPRPTPRAENWVCFSARFRLGSS